jgi:hypothetical protein
MTSELTKLRNLARGIMDFASRFVDERGPDRLPPTWHIEALGEVFVIATPFSGPEDKDAVAAYIRGFLKMSGAERYAFVSESWTRQPLPSERPETLEGNVCDHPDRREVIHVHAEDAERVVTMECAILRTEHGEKRWRVMEPKEISAHEKTDFDRQLNARFSNLIVRRP